MDMISGILGRPRFGGMPWTKDIANITIGVLMGGIEVGCVWHSSQRWRRRNPYVFTSKIWDEFLSPDTFWFVCFFFPLLSLHFPNFRQVYQFCTGWNEQNSVAGVGQHVDHARSGGTVLGVGVKEHARHGWRYSLPNSVLFPTPSPFLSEHFSIS